MGEVGIYYNHKSEYVNLDAALRKLNLINKDDLLASYRTLPELEAMRDLGWISDAEKFFVVFESRDRIPKDRTVFATQLIEAVQKNPSIIASAKA